MFLSLLVQHSERWHVAGLILPAQLLPVLDPIRNRLPILSDLTFRPAEHVPGDSHSRLSHFSNAPSLQSLRLHSVDQEDVYSFPLQQTANLSVTQGAMPDNLYHFVDLLYSLPHLQNLHFAFNSHPISMDHRQIFHPRLSTLRLDLCKHHSSYFSNSFYPL